MVRFTSLKTGVDTAAKCELIIPCPKDEPMHLEVGAHHVCAHTLMAPAPRVSQAMAKANKAKAKVKAA